MNMSIVAIVSIAIASLATIVLAKASQGWLTLLCIGLLWAAAVTTPLPVLYGS